MTTESDQLKSGLADTWWKSNKTEEEQKRWNNRYKVK